MNLLQVTQLSEIEARSYIESIVWPAGPKCPHCGNQERISTIKGKSARPGLYSCGVCRKQFTVTVGTIMENSHISCKKWVVAFHLMCSSKKGVSACQLQRELGLKSYESAWFLAQRIRAAMEEAMKLSGTVEVDETYVGGKNQPGTKRGRGTKKAPVLALVSREGNMRSHPLKAVYGKELKGAIREIVSPDSRIMTDELNSYRGIGSDFKGGHHTVNHSLHQYSRGDIHVNNAESYFALLKRGVHGTFHHVSKKHLNRYCLEFSFRWNHRKTTDGQRCYSAISLMSGKRLTYKQLTR